MKIVMEPGETLNVNLGETCECEHGSHFPDEGGKGHEYATKPSRVVVKTTYATMAICWPCYDMGHMKGKLVGKVVA